MDKESILELCFKVSTMITEIGFMFQSEISSLISRVSTGQRRQVQVNDFCQSVTSQGGGGGRY